MCDIMVYWPVFVFGLLMAAIGMFSALHARAGVEAGLSLGGIEPTQVTEAGKEQAARRERIVGLLFSLFVGGGIMLFSFL